MEYGSEQDKNIDSIEDFKEHIKEWKPTTCICKLCL